MKKSLFVTSLSLVGTLLLTGCTYKSAGFVKYDKKFYSATEAGNQSYKEIGPVMVSESDFIWTDCNIIARNALEKLYSTTIANGGDSVMNIKWTGENGLQFQSAQCQQQYGWLLVWPLFLGPWTQHVRVEGTIIKFDDNKKEK